MSLKDARVHLDLAQEQWERACTDAWEPSDPASCVTQVFYAYENLIVSVAEAQNISWERSHYSKAILARELFEKKILSQDLHDELLRLNGLRKDVSYGEPGFELVDEDLEDLVSSLESVLDEVSSMVSEKEEDASDE